VLRRPAVVTPGQTTPQSYSCGEVIGVSGTVTKRTHRFIIIIIIIIIIFVVHVTRKQTHGRAAKGG